MPNTVPPDVGSFHCKGLEEAVMQDDFQRSLKFTLGWEGGYSNHPNDRGGPTMRGITWLVYNKFRLSRGLKLRAVKNISSDEVGEIYRLNYWNKSVTKGMVWPLNAATFDLAVNSGVNRAKKFNFEIGTAGTPLERAVRLVARRKRFFLAIVAYKRSQAVFLDGWLNRIAGISRLIQEPASSVPAPKPNLFVPFDIDVRLSDAEKNDPIVLTAHVVAPGKAYVKNVSSSGLKALIEFVKTKLSGGTK
jgi:hypothetical protein